MHTLGVSDIFISDNIGGGTGSGKRMRSLNTENVAKVVEKELRENAYFYMMRPASNKSRDIKTAHSRSQ